MSIEINGSCKASEYEIGKAEAIRIRDALNSEKSTLKLEMDEYDTFITNIEDLRTSLFSTISKNDNTHDVIRDAISGEGINSSIENVTKYSLNLGICASNLYSLGEEAKSARIVKEDEYNAKDRMVIEIECKWGIG